MLPPPRSQRRHHPAEVAARRRSRSRQSRKTNRRADTGIGHRPHPRHGADESVPTSLGERLAVAKAGSSICVAVPNASPGAGHPGPRRSRFSPIRSGRIESRRHLSVPAGGQKQGPVTPRRTGGGGRVQGLARRRTAGQEDTLLRFRITYGLDEALRVTAACYDWLLAGVAVGLSERRPSPRSPSSTLQANGSPSTKRASTPSSPPWCCARSPTSTRPWRRSVGCYDLEQRSTSSSTSRPMAGHGDYAGSDGSSRVGKLWRETAISPAALRTPSIQQASASPKSNDRACARCPPWCDRHPGTSDP